MSNLPRCKKLFSRIRTIARAAGRLKGFRDKIARKKAFLLIEVVIACAIFTLFLTYAGKFYIYASDLVIQSCARMHALDDAIAVLEGNDEPCTCCQIATRKVIISVKSILEKKLLHRAYTIPDFVVYNVYVTTAEKRGKKQMVKIVGPAIT